MAETRTITVNGVTYNITDYSSGGISLDDMERVIRNVNKTDAYKDEISNDLRDSSIATNKVIDVYIDSPERNGTGTFIPESASQTAINMDSSNFTDDPLNTYGEEVTGNNVQNDVDSVFVHEVAHLHQERIGEDENGDGIPDPHDGSTR